MQFGSAYLTPSYKGLIPHLERPWLHSQPPPGSKKWHQPQEASSSHQRLRSMAAETSPLESEMLSAYFDRIYLPVKEQAEIANGEVSISTLSAICKSHVQAIPFENLDLVYEPAKALSKGRIGIDVESVFQKLVRNERCHLISQATEELQLHSSTRYKAWTWDESQILDNPLALVRGGYCFETNALLAYGLKAAGFQMHSAAARVIVGKRSDHSDEIQMGGLDHEVILVQLEGDLWVCDAGFGGQTPRAPVQIVDPPLAQDDIPGEGLHRVRRGLLASKRQPEDFSSSSHQQGWYMQHFSRNRKTWDDLYFFTEQEWRQVDFEIPNYWCSNQHPLFCKQIVVALQTHEGRKTISGSKLRLAGAEGVKEYDLSDEEDLKAALSKHFGLHIPES